MDSETFRFVMTLTLGALGTVLCGLSVVLYNVGSSIKKSLDKLDERMTKFDEVIRGELRLMDVRISIVERTLGLMAPNNHVRGQT